MAYTRKPWAETMTELRACMERWGVGRAWTVECAAPPSRREQERPEDERRVTLHYMLPSGEERTLSTAKFPRPADNLRAIYLTVEAIRLAEGRGLGELMRQHYALPAPSMQPWAPSPWDVLGVQRGAPPEVVAAAYRALAKRHHPDAGGDPAVFLEIQRAFDDLMALAAGRN
ncbi:MAG: J domain-containing protein [Fimbriimonadales bacterium]|nr:J domain-containing protein [Fimbriimonadales bacterium]